MKILMISWFGDKRNSGGMEVHIGQLSRNLSALGHSVELIVPDSCGMQFNEESGVKITRVPCNAQAASLDETIKSIKAYNKKIIAKFMDSKNAFDFDVIHSHDWLGVEAAQFLSREHKKPWIHTVHSLEHIRAAEETEALEKRISDIERLGISGCDKIITVSNLMKKEIAKKFLVPDEKIFVIYNGAAYGHEDAVRKCAIKNASQTVLFVGRLALQKGIEHLILAFQKVLDNRHSVKLVIAGGGNLDRGLKSLVLSLGLEKSVAFKGFVEESELEKLYSGATIFVSPSVFEPFGITLIDAALLGVPAVATKNTGCLELFSDGSVAVVEPEDSGALAGEIIRLLRDEDARKKMTESAKSDLKKADNWKIIARKTAAVYSG